MPGYIARAQRDDWNTPQDVVDLVGQFWHGGVDLDPCSNSNSLVVARRRVVLPEDGLAVPWSGRVFVNPPYGDLARWLAKANEVGATRAAEVIFLCPARVDTRGWHAYASRADLTLFWKGRMRFLGAPASAPFPSALLYWGWQPETFASVFGGRGLLMRRH